MIHTLDKRLQEFVRPTRYCDADTPEIIAKADTLTMGTNTPGEAALAVFHFVRDHFKFGLAPVTQKASETLRGTTGFCVTKTNLQIALLRSLGIPARYHQVSLTKKILKGIVSPMGYLAIKEPIWYHPWCECFIDDRWIACDLFLDRDTYQAAINAGLFASSDMPTIDWDGKNDLFTVKKWMLEDHGVHRSYDQVIEEVEKEFAFIPSFIVGGLLKRSNRFTARFRETHA